MKKSLLILFLAVFVWVLVFIIYNKTSDVPVLTTKTGALDIQSIESIASIIWSGNIDPLIMKKYSGSGYVWLAPMTAVTIAKEVEESFSKSEPQKRLEYENNFKRFESEVTLLRKEFISIKYGEKEDARPLEPMAFVLPNEKYEPMLDDLEISKYQYYTYDTYKKLTPEKQQEIRIVFMDETLPEKLQLPMIPTAKIFPIKAFAKDDYIKTMRENLSSLKNIYR